MSTNGKAQSPQASLALAGTVHDLNNVFQTLIGVAVQLEEQPGSAGLANAILRSVERAQHLVAGLQGSAAEPASLREILSHAETFLKDFLSASHGPAIDVTYALEGSVKLSNPWAWERVFINLFLNSARAMPRGGTIRVEARHSDNRIELTLTDDGTGIPGDILDRIFEPRVSGYGSSGLGLTIVETMVKASGGHVRASNREDTTGTIFHMTLPIGATVSK